MNRSRSVTWIGILLFVHLVPFICCSRAGSFADMFPWGKQTVKERQELLLEALRDTLHLEVKEELLPGFLKASNENKMFIKNVEGQTFSISKHTPGLDVNADEVKSHKKKSDKPPTPLALIHTDVSTLSQHLTGVCAALSVDYWNFEWCHRKEVRQVHWDIANAKVTRNPDWSLGSFKNTVVTRQRGDSSNTSDPITEVFLYIAQDFLLTIRQSLPDVFDCSFVLTDLCLCISDG